MHTCIASGLITYCANVHIQVTKLNWKEEGLEEFSCYMLLTEHAIAQTGVDDSSFVSIGSLTSPHLLSTSTSLCDLAVH